MQTQDFLRGNCFWEWKINISLRNNCSGSGTGINQQQILGVSAAWARMPLPPVLSTIPGCALLCTAPWNGAKGQSLSDWVLTTMSGGVSAGGLSWYNGLMGGADKPLCPSLSQEFVHCVYACCAGLDPPSQFRLTRSNSKKCVMRYQLRLKFIMLNIL